MIDNGTKSVKNYSNEDIIRMTSLNPLFLNVKMYFSVGHLAEVYLTR